jgi:hypothetical protein
MNGRTRRATPLLVVALASFMLLASIPTSGSPSPQNAATVRATEDAARLIQENRLQESLETLDRAIDADADYWEAHYQRGRALGLMSRWQESRDALLRATELNPGHGHSHLLASLAAINIDDWDTAWDQAIKAQLAGEDMTQSLLSLYQMSPPPDDFAIRISAATVFVADIDTTTAAADIELPTNFNPNAATGTGERQGRASDLEDSAINQSSLDLIRLQRAMRTALAESPRLAVVLDPGRAKFILAIQLTDISTSQPNSASGYFRVIDIEKREVVYRQPIDIENLGSMPLIVGKLRRYVTDLAAWLAKQEGGSN